MSCRTPTRPSSTPTTLYRAYDAQGQLLYVGISYDALSRLSQHATAGWSHYAASITLQRHPNRESAAAAELAAIRTEDPVFNMAGRPLERSLQWLAAYPGNNPDDIDPEALAAEVLASAGGA